MVSQHEDRFPVLSPRLAVPSQEELEKRFRAFWLHMRRHTGKVAWKTKLDHSQERKVKALAEEAYDRRMREAGLSALKTTALSAIIALARDGARLGGPSAEHAVHQLAAALHAESGWMRDVSAWIMNEMLRHVAAGGRGFALPPVILAGPPGIGKSHYARALARALAVPVRMIDVGGGSAGFRISGTERGWSTAQPGIPVETVLAGKVANPVMVVDEIDKAGTVHSTRGTSTSLTTSLLQMLEPGTARHFECPFHRVTFDMSRVVWIMTANEVDRIPPPLRDRSRLFVLPKLSAPDAVAHFDRLTEGCGDGADLARCHRFIARMCERPEGISLRQIGQLANAAGAPMPQVMH